MKKKEGRVAISGGKNTLDFHHKILQKEKALNDLLNKARNINLEKDPFVYLDLEITVQEILSRSNRNVHSLMYELENELIYTYNKLKPYVDDPGLKARKKRNKKLIILIIIVLWLGTNLIVYLFSD